MIGLLRDTVIGTLGDDLAAKAGSLVGPEAAAGKILNAQKPLSGNSNLR